MSTQLFAERMQEELPMLILSFLVIGAGIGWWLHKTIVRNRIETRPVYESTDHNGNALETQPIGWRVFIGRVTLGRLYQVKSEADSHEEAIRELL